MARKLRTGFELPFANTGTTVSKSFAAPSSYLWQSLYIGTIADVFVTEFLTLTGTITNSALTIENTTIARSKGDGSRGCILKGNSDGNGSVMMLDTTAFSSGLYCNYWIYLGTGIVGPTAYTKLMVLYDGTNSYQVYIRYNGTAHEVAIAQNNTSTILEQTSLGLTLSASTWYNVSVGVNNTGDITGVLNGTSVTYNTSVSFANWTRLGIAGLRNTTVNGRFIDDLAINDGSGASDNGVPNSIRAYNFFDTATLNTNSGFAAVGGTTVLANLQDGSDSTRASASADLSYIDFSLPTLSGTGMSETASNFTKIEAINVYGRQIEATKASSLLKAKVTDTVAVVNREENLSLPLNVGNDSVSMFDDGSSDWVLANLDSGDMDFRVTFDKP